MIDEGFDENITFPLLKGCTLVLMVAQEENYNLRIASDHRGQYGSGFGSIVFFTAIWYLKNLVPSLGQVTSLTTGYRHRINKIRFGGSTCASVYCVRTTEIARLLTEFSPWVLSSLLNKSAGIHFVS